MHRIIALYACTAALTAAAIVQGRADELRAKAREEAHERARREMKEHPENFPPLNTAEYDPILHGFTNGFIDAANRKDAVTQSNYYGPTVDYMNYGTVSRSFVLQDIRKYNDKWPVRRLLMQSWQGITGDEAHGADVRYTIQFMVERPGKTITGIAEEHLKILEIKGVNSIIWQRETVTLRH
jgi:hypothetical protein